MTTVRRGTGRSAWLIVVAAVIGLVWGLAWGTGGGVLAAEDSLIQYQGRIMERQGDRLIIDERPFELTKSTKVLTRDKKPASERQLVHGQWVGVVAESTADGLQIETIYLIPQRLTGPAELALFAQEAD